MTLAVRGNVLLVDDEPALRRALARTLRRDGHIVIEASTAMDATDAMTKHPNIDVVLSDIMMPDVTGVDLLQYVREHNPDVSFILMTGVPDLGTAVKAVEYGAFEYLLKPMDLERLGESVVRAINRHRSAVSQRGKVRSGGSGAPIGTGGLLAERYRLGRLIGHGGMGTVYEAQREDLGLMPVAVKVLHPRFAACPTQLVRFRREAELIATIHHPNIVNVLDFVSTDEGQTFLVMELLRGTTLATAIARESVFSEHRVAFIASQILAALGAAHAINVVHRDLKPENVFLINIAGVGDVVKLLDFGIAKLLSSPEEGQLTETGTVLGTPAYMSPEYARGENADALNDIYALGCVMYEMLARKEPIVAANYNALLFAIQEAAPEPLGSIRPDLSPEIVAVVSRAMAKDRSTRFACSHDMEIALAPWLSPSSRRQAFEPYVPRIGSAQTEAVTLDAPLQQRK